MIEGIIVYVLVVVWPLDNDVLLTAAKEVDWRSDCLEMGELAKQRYPNSRYTCTAYEVLRDADTGRTTDDEG